MPFARGSSAVTKAARRSAQILIAVARASDVSDKSMRTDDGAVDVAPSAAAV
jgi:hypothetical protein